MARALRLKPMTVLVQFALILGLVPQQSASADSIFDLLRVDRPQRPRYQPPASQNRRPAPRPAAPVEDGAGSAKKKALMEFRRQPRDGMPIMITRTEWTDEDERRFGAFVARIGKARAAKKCRSVKSCMQLPEANMYASKDAPGLILYSDCADYPYFLRAYFAYHNGLPFGYVREVEKATRPSASVANQDEYVATKGKESSPYGNLIIARGGSNVPKRVGSEINLVDYLERMFDMVWTATYRVGALSPGFGNSDLYPVKVDRSGIGPGTVVHSTGHALIVWGIDSSGLVHAMDAHPDGSLSIKLIQPANLDRSRPDHGLGFYRFRPLTLEGAEQSSQGYLYGGRIVPASDRALFAQGKWSLEQWFGPRSDIAPGATVDPHAWSRGYKGINFFDFLASRMRQSGRAARADEAVVKVMSDLCEQFRDRVNDIAESVAQGNPRIPHPETLPADVFGEEDPTWGVHSRSGRDARLRSGVGDLLQTAVSQFRAAKSGDASVRFDGSAEDYVRTLRKAFAELNKTCVVRYRNSAGRAVTLNLKQMLERLPRMSFDPYHCPEKSWGASGAELATCRDQDAGNRWYQAERYMRNTAGKLTDGGLATLRSRRPITIEMLQDTALIDQPDSSDTNLGSSRPPVTNLDEALASPKFLERLR